uniref:Uncharacterized protein n=1 Tax=Zea mays TaxID=4577 RepID=C4IZD5_MAIZE|nr:unknown [Zea mays]
MPGCGLLFSCIVLYCMYCIREALAQWCGVVWCGKQNK